MDSVEGHGWEGIAFAPAVAIGAIEQARIAGAIGSLIGACGQSPLAIFVTPDKSTTGRAIGGLELSRSDALDCCSELLRESDVAMARGEFVTAYALLGIEGRLLEELVEAGRLAG